MKKLLILALFAAVTFCAAAQKVTAANRARISNFFISKDRLTGFKSNKDTKNGRNTLRTGFRK